LKKAHGDLARRMIGTQKGANEALKWKTKDITASVPTNRA